MADAPQNRAAGTIYDLGYQHYKGERRGRGYAFTTLLGHSFKAAFGVGRGPKAQQVPGIVTILIIMPAMIMVGIGSVSQQPQIINYAQHIQMSAFFLALFIAGQAPEVLVGDKETGTLSLYLSRSLHTTDYAIAKLLAVALALFALTFGSQFIMFAGKILLSAEPWPAFKGEWTKLFPMIGGTGLISLYLAAIGLTLSSFAGKRNNGSAMVISFFFLLPALSGIVREIVKTEAQRYMVLINPFTLISGFANWLYEIQARRGSDVLRADLPGEYYLYVMLGTTALAVAIVLQRYWRPRE